MNFPINSKWKIPEKPFCLYSIFLLLIVTCPALIPSSFAQNVKDPAGGITEIIKKAEAAGKSDKASGKDAEKKSPPRATPAQIAERIKMLSTQERKKRMDFMAVVIEDVSRLCDLSEAQEEELALAAKGASERSMKKWHEKATRYFSSRLKDADGDAAIKILKTLQNVSFGGREAEKESEMEELWKDTLKNVLTEEQVKQYEEILELRRKNKVAAYAQISIASLDDFLRLTPGQKDTLGKIVRGSAEKYLDEVQRYWGNYFEKGMLMALANIAEDDELKEILSKKQFDRHKGATTNFEHFWLRKRKEIKAAEENKKKAEEEAQKKSDVKKIEPTEKD